MYEKVDGVIHSGTSPIEVSLIDVPINSDIEVGGTLYRWYKTTPGSTIYIDSQYLDYHQPNEEGVFDISFNTSKHGITSPQTIDIVTNSVIVTKDSQDIPIDPSIFNFNVDIVPRNYTTLWFWEESSGAGGGIIAYAKGERTINFQMETGNLDSILEMRRYKDDKITIGLGFSLFEADAGVVKVGAMSADAHGDRRNLYGSQVSVDYENADDKKKLEGILYILTSELATDPTPLVFEAVEAISNELSKDLPVDYYESGIAGGPQSSVYLMSLNIGPKEVDIVNQDIMRLNLEMGVSFVDRVYPSTNYEEYITQHTYKFDKDSAISVLGDEIIKFGDTEYIDVSTIVGAKDSNIIGKMKIKNSEEKLGLSDYKYKEVTHDYGVIDDEDLANQISINKLKSRSLYSDFIQKEDIKENAIVTISETRGTKKGFKLPISVEILGAKVYLSKGDISASENNYILEKIVYKDSKPYIQETYRYDGYVSNPAESLSEIRMSLLSPLNEIMKDVSWSITKEIIKAGMKAAFNTGVIAFDPSTLFSDKSSSVEMVISSFAPNKPSAKINALFKSAGLSSSYISTVSGSYFVIGNITDLQPYNISFEPAAELHLKYSDNDVSGIDELKILIYNWDSKSAAWIPLNSAVNVDLNIVSTNITSFGTYAVGYDVADPTIYWDAGNISYGGINVDAHITDEGSGINQSSIKLYLDGVPQVCTYMPVSGKLSSYIPAGNKTHTVKIYAEDTSGNSNYKEIDIVVLDGIHEEVIFADDFDSYATGSFPSSGGWNLKYNGMGDSYQIVDNSQSVSSPNSLKLEGEANWAATADHPLAETPDQVIYEVDVKVTQPGSSVMNYPDAAIGLANPNIGTWGTRYAGVIFGNAENRVIQPGNIPFNFDQWYHIKVEADMNNGVYDVWLDDQLIASDISTSSNGDYTHIRLEGGNNAHTRVWFDNVKVYRGDKLKNIKTF